MIGASRSSIGPPASRAVASDTTAVATKGLDTDARWNIVSGVTDPPLSRSRTPNPRETTSSSRTTATARPATSCEPRKVSSTGHKPSSTLRRRRPILVKLSVRLLGSSRRVPRRRPAPLSQVRAAPLRPCLGRSARRPWIRTNQTSTVWTSYGARHLARGSGEKPLDVLACHSAARRCGLGERAGLRGLRGGEHGRPSSVVCRRRGVMCGRDGVGGCLRGGLRGVGGVLGCFGGSLRFRRSAGRRRLGAGRRRLGGVCSVGGGPGRVPCVAGSPVGAGEQTTEGDLCPVARDLVAGHGLSELVTGLAAQGHEPLHLCL